MTIRLTDVSMPDEPYLMRLAQRLNRGLARLDSARRQRHRDFIFSQQMPDGGFRGREGDSDLYYTAFAVRSLAVLGALQPEDCTGLSRFVRAQFSKRLNVIDLVSWLYTGLVLQLVSGDDPFAEADSHWTDDLAARLESTRTADGGYAKSTEGAAGSTYQSFLTALTYELIGRDVPRPKALVQFLFDRQRDDGGFVEIAPMKRSGTNPTAAAVALLTKFGAMDEEIRGDVADFLKQVCSSDGGFQANTRIPFADGLSTFTGLLTCQDLGLEGILTASRAERFVTDPQHGLELPGGGFRGAAWDEQADVEYTFYGLGTLGLVWSE